MLNILTLPEEKLKGLTISKAPHLYMRKRGNSLLVLNPAIGKYTIFKEPFISFFRKIDKPIFYLDFIKNEEKIPPALYIAFLEEAFSKGIINLSGRILQQEEKNITSSPPLVFQFYDTSSVKLHHSDVLSAIQREEETYIAFIDLPFYEVLENMYLWEKEGEKHSHKVYFHIINPPDEMGEYVDKLREFCYLSVTYRVNSPLKAEVISKVINLQKKGISSSLDIVFDKPEDILKTSLLAIEEGILALGIKISTKTVLEKVPISKHIRRMERFAYSSIEALDKIMDFIGGSRKRVLLYDIHRFYYKLLYGDTLVFPCGGRPCNVDRIITYKDEKRYMCIPKEKWNLKGVRNIPTRCAKCVWRAFCRGGCALLAYQKYGSFEREDPRCRYFQIMYEEILWKDYNCPMIIDKIGGIFAT